MKLRRPPRPHARPVLAAPTAPTRPAPAPAAPAKPVTAPVKPVTGKPVTAPVKPPGVTPRETPDGNRPAGRHLKSVRAIIGDELRLPTLWCQFGSCISHFADTRALGERDLRTRAIAAGWRYDALGRLACPSCVQHDSAFWPTCPPAIVDGTRGPAFVHAQR